MRQSRRKEARLGFPKDKHHLHIELTAEQYQQLFQQAKLSQEIHHIGNNINQSARSVNAGIAMEEDAQHGLFLLEQIYELMYQVANK